MGIKIKQNKPKKLQKMQDGDKVVELKTLDEYNEAIKETCVIDFTASWCPPCQRIKPVFAEMSKEDDNTNIKFYKVDVDENKDASEAAGIEAMPTFHFYKEGEKKETLRGANVEKIKEQVAALR